MYQRNRQTLPSHFNRLVIKVLFLDNRETNCDQDRENINARSLHLLYQTATLKGANLEQPHSRHYLYATCMQHTEGKHMNEILLAVFAGLIVGVFFSAINFHCLRHQYYQALWVSLVFTLVVLHTKI